MKKNLDRKMEVLNNKLLEMMGMVEWNLNNGFKSLYDRDKLLSLNIMELDEEINKKEKEIEKICFELILLEHPVARDLRVISATLKVINDLERIGDYTKNICEENIKLIEEKYLEDLDILSFKIFLIEEILNKSIDAFINRDIQLSEYVIYRDKTINKTYTNIINQLKYKKNFKTPVLLCIISIANYLERIGDHAKNIAEWGIYIGKGK